MPSIFPDLTSKITEAAREALHGQFQVTNLLGGLSPTNPLKENIARKKSRAMISPVVISGPDDRKVTPPTLLGPVGTEGQQQNNKEQPAKKYNNLVIKDLINGNKIELPFVPLELDYVPDSKFIPIPSMGRNNPNYHYTGSEDTLKFVIDWNSTVADNSDVIRNCKTVEALSKNDGFGSPPHTIALLWNDTLFNDAIWIVVSAPYKLSLFNRAQSMLPRQAYQTVTLKKVTEINLTSEKITSITT